MPVFWGRYFTSTSTGGLVEYRGLKENQALRDNNISCPAPSLARLPESAGTLADGATDAQANADDILSTFGAAYLATLSGNFYVFLDVENLPALSVPYYTGWAQTLSAHSQSVTNGSVTLTPCVYGMRSDNTTWTAVATAVAAGVPCAGVWIARYPLPGCQPLPDWDVAKVSPAVALPCPIPHLAICRKLSRRRRNRLLRHQSQHRPEQRSAVAPHPAARHVRRRQLAKPKIRAPFIASLSHAMSGTRR